MIAYFICIAANISARDQVRSRIVPKLGRRKEPRIQHVTSVMVIRLKAGGVTTVRLPAKSPNLNAYAERFVRSIKEECLNRVVPFSEQHLRELLCNYQSHYHMERNHQGLENRLLKPSADVISLDRPVRKRERLGGLLNYYYREAA